VIEGTPVYCTSPVLNLPLRIGVSQSNLVRIIVQLQWLVHPDALCVFLELKLVICHWCIEFD
jgi:hypothetical protein